MAEDAPQIHRTTRPGSKHEEAKGGAARKM